MSYIFCWHKWSPWSKIVNCYTAPYQYSYCKKCNKIIKRRVSITGNEVNTSAWNHGPDEVQHD